jgi:integrase
MIDSIHTVLHQVLEMAVEDSYMRNNPSDNALKELKKTQLYRSEKRTGLTIQQQELLLEYLLQPKYRHWYPIFSVLVGTGMRVGEATGLRWQALDLEMNTQPLR